MLELSFDDRIYILETYQKSAIEIFENYKHLLTNPELELRFELSDPNIHASMINKSELGTGLAVCAVHCQGCIILMLDVILDSALLIIDLYDRFIKSDEDCLMVIWHVLEHTLLHEMQHAGQPFHLLNGMCNVIPDIEYTRRETDADYTANKILMEDFGAPEWFIEAITQNGYGLPMQLAYDQSQLHDIALYYYEFIKTFYCLSLGKYGNDILELIQTAVFEFDNIYVHNNINGRNDVMCIKQNGKFYPPTREFCYLYNITFLGINEQDFKDEPYLIYINAEPIGENGARFIIGGERLIPAFTKDLGCYYNT